MKKITFFISIILFLFIINNFYHSIHRLWQKQDLVVTARKELAREKQEQRMLQQQLEKVEHPAYLEQEARNSLFLVKPGEQVIVLPASGGQEEETQQEIAPPDPVWLQWYKLFM